MTENDDLKSTPPILSSSFFEPSIIKTFLRITLANERFPTLAIHFLMQSEDDHESESNLNDQKETNERINALRSAAKSDTNSPFYLQKDQKQALTEAIQALGTFLALPDSHDRMEEILQQRVMLGFCRILNNQPIEGALEFDLVRKALYSKLNKLGKDKETTIDRGKEDYQVYAKALWGAELTAKMMGKENEAERFRKWRLSAMKKKD